MGKITKDKIDAIRQDLSADEYTKTEIGVIPSDWRIARLSDIAEKATQTAGTGSYETVSISAGIGFVNQAKKFGKELSGKQYEKYTVLHKGDFSYNKGNSTKYPQGCIYRLKDRETAAVPNVFESFRIQSECAEFYDHLFVSGFLNQQLSKKINHGVRDDGLLNLTEKDFYSCLLPVPPLAEQKRISEILDHYDKLINLCDAEVNEYKSLKKTCLRKMFPQNGSNVPEIRFPGFTGAWEQRKLGDMCSLITKGTTPLDKSNSGTVNFVKIESIDESSGEIEITQKISQEEHNGYLRRSQLRENDILFSIAGTLGRVTSVKSDILPANTNQALAILRLKNGSLPYVKTYLKGKAVADFIKKNPTIGAQPNLSLEQVGNLEIALPSDKEQELIGAYFANLDRLITLHQRKVDEYTKLKKAITQLLLTGIVRVK